MNKDSNSRIKVLIGIGLILFGVLLLINNGYIIQSFVIVFTFIFGFIAYWFFFPSMILVGILLIINKNKEIKIKKTSKIIALGLLTFSLLVLSTTSAYLVEDTTLTLSTFNSTFMKTWSKATASRGYGVPNMMHVNQLYPLLSGGWFGHLLAALLNTVLTPVGTIVSTSLIIVGAFILLFYKQLVQLIAYIRSRIKKNKTIKNNLEEKTIDHIDDVEVTPVTQSNINVDNLSQVDNDMFEESGTLKRANLFSDDSDLMNNQDIIIEDTHEEVSIQKAYIDEGIFEEKLNETPTNNIVSPKSETPKIEKPYQLPPTSLLTTYQIDDVVAKNEEHCQYNESVINQTFANFRIGARVVGHTIGPRVTRYDIQIDATSSIQAIPRYVSDISQRLGGVSARFEPIVTGKVTSGLEVPNLESATIGFKEMLEALPKGDKNRLMIPFGKNISGETKYANLGGFPHLLIGGATGSGKSVFVHSIIMSLIMRNTPKDIRFLLIDPKRVEFVRYKNSPFLLCPVVTDAKKAQVALNKLCEEMDRRYTLFEGVVVNNIANYNIKMREKNAEPLPYIICIVDEFADLIMVNKKVDLDIARIVQKARAAGIHLIIATQRPSVDVITGTIKNNLPVRVALRVPDVESSKTIIGGQGAEGLLGNGDMLVSCPQIQANGNVRVQGCYVSDKEIDDVVKFINSQREPIYDPRFMDLEDHQVADIKSNPMGTSGDDKDPDEELYNFIKEGLYSREYTSISMIQRENGIGFNRAGRMFKRLQNEGLVSLENEASKGNKVLKENFGIKDKEDKIGSEEVSKVTPNN